jgi:hypothetical protein
MGLLLALKVDIANVSLWSDRKGAPPHLHPGITKSDEKLQVIAAPERQCRGPAPGQFSKK